MKYQLYVETIINPNAGGAGGTAVSQITISFANKGLADLAAEQLLSVAQSPSVGRHVVKLYRHSNGTNETPTEAK